MADDEKKSEEEKSNPWERIEGIVRKVVGEELGKWETESPNGSQSSEETQEKTSEATPQSQEPSKSSARKTGFLSKAFGISE